MLPAGQRRQPKARPPVAIQAGSIPTNFPAILSLHPRRPSAGALAWRLQHENSRKIGRLRRHHRLRPDRRRSLRRASLRNPARYRARHSAPRRHLRQRLRQKGQSRSRKSARHRSGHPAQDERKEQACLLRPHPLQGSRPHRAGRRTAQALQAGRAPMRNDRTKLQINRQLRRRHILLSRFFRDACEKLVFNPTSFHA